MKPATLLFLAPLLFTVNIAAQPTGTPFTIGEQFTIESKVLGEQRSIIIGLPARYEFSDARYPVLYLLDGAAHFHYATGITELLAANVNQLIPEMIVVAVNNTDRSRDMTPPSLVESEQRSNPSHGGADNFQRFFAEDLIPWVEDNYRTHPYRVLSGHSLGGLFAVHTLTTRPDLFNAYIAISPSMYWNAQGLVDQAESFFSSTSELPVSLYMSAGNEGNELLGGTRKLAGVLDLAAPRDFQWQFEHMPQETHGSVSYRSVYQGLQFVFANWALRNPYDVYTRFGLDAVERFYAIGDQRYGFNRGVPQVTLAYLLGDMVRAGQLDDAVTLMSKPSAIQTAQISTITFLADALRDNGDQDQATIFYRQVLGQNPGNTTARNALGEMGADYSDVVPNPQIDDETLDRYVGAYFNERVGDISVLSEEGRLHLEMNAGRVQLLPLNDSEFYRLGSDIQYSFQVSEDGEVKGVQLRQGEFELYVERR